MKTMIWTLGLGLSLATAGLAQDIELETAKALVESMRKAGRQIGKNSQPLLAQAPRNGYAQPSSEQQLDYETSCQIDGATVNGYVRNKSGENYWVSGMVRFRFYWDENSMARRMITAPALAFVPANQTALVASSHIPFILEKGEICRFEVEGVIGK